MRPILTAILLTFVAASAGLAAGPVTLSLGERVEVRGDGCNLGAAYFPGGQTRLLVECLTAELLHGVPICAHDPTAYHPLVRRDDEGSIACTYGHEHGDDPAEAEAAFGAPGSWYGGTTSISYPWHTPMENEMKHWFYKYLVRTDLRPLPSIQLDQYRDLSIRNVRAVGHLEGFSTRLDNGMQAGFPGVNHSYSVEAEVCREGGRCGTIQIGGWQNYGNGMLTDQSGADVCVLPDPIGGCASERAARRIHGGPDSFRRDFTWYGSNWDGSARDPNRPRIGAELGTIGEATGYVDPADYTTLHAYGPPFNGSWYSLEILALYVPAELDADRDGYVTYEGVATRWGTVRPASECQGEMGHLDYGPDCAPVRLVDAPVGYVQYRDSSHDAAYGTTYGNGREHDALIEVDGRRESLIRFPN